MARIGFHPAVIPLRALNPANETVQAGKYLATTLSAVDADLATGNIKKDVNIFGKVGTFEATLAEDVVGSATTTLVTDTSDSGYKYSISVPLEADLDIATKTQTYADPSLAIAVGYCYVEIFANGVVKMRLYMNGVQVAESAYAVAFNTTAWILVASRALTGSTICKIALHNYDTEDRPGLFTVRHDGDIVGAGIGIGSATI